MTIDLEMDIQAISTTPDDAVIRLVGLGEVIFPEIESLTTIYLLEDPCNGEL